LIFDAKLDHFRDLADDRELTFFDITNGTVLTTRSTSSPATVSKRRVPSPRRRAWAARAPSTALCRRHPEMLELRA